MSTNVSNINWGNLTAREILQYEEEGVDVPDAYETWAEKADKNATETYSDAHTGNNEAYNFRVEMKASGASDNDIAKAFIKNCNEQEKLIDKSILEIGRLTGQSETIAANIQDITSISQAELSKMQLELTSANTQEEADSVVDKINATANNASSTVEGYSAELTTISGAINSAKATVENASEFANETIELANDLKNSKDNLIDEFIEGGMVAATTAAFASDGIALTGSIGATIVGLAEGSVIVTPFGLALLGTTALGVGITELLLGNKKTDNKFTQETQNAGTKLNKLVAYSETLIKNTETACSDANTVQDNAVNTINDESTVKNTTISDDKKETVSPDETSADVTVDKTIKKKGQSV